MTEATTPQVGEPKTAIEQIAALSEKHGFEANLGNTVAKAEGLLADLTKLFGKDFLDLAVHPATEKERRWNPNEQGTGVIKDRQKIAKSVMLALQNITVDGGVIPVFTPEFDEKRVLDTADASKWILTALDSLIKQERELQQFFTTMQEAKDGKKTGEIESSVVRFFNKNASLSSFCDALTNALSVRTALEIPLLNDIHKKAGEIHHTCYNETQRPWVLPDGAEPSPERQMFDKLLKQALAEHKAMPKTQVPSQITEATVLPVEQNRQHGLGA